MNIQNTSQLSIMELINWFTTMLKVIQPLKGDIQTKLKDILEKGRLHAEALSEQPDKLKQEIDLYFQQNKPFEWNRDNSSNSIDVRVEKDWEQHDTLTLFAMLLNSKDILKKWGVDYPLNVGGPGLADSSRKYIDLLKKVRDNCGVKSQKEYYDYLINQLSSHAKITG